MFSILLAVSLSVSAAEPPAIAPDPAKAKELFNAGKKLFDQGKYAQAVQKFEEAYAARPHPIIFFNIGKCYELIGETGEGETGKALRAYRAYLRAIPDASDKPAVNDSIANLERRLRDRGLQQVTIFAEPAKAKIEVDGKDIGAAPATVELKLGPHTLVVKADGFETVERPFTVSSVRSQELTVSLKPGTTEIPSSDSPKKDELKQPSNAAISQPPPSTVVANTAVNPEVVKKPPPVARKGRLFTWIAAGVAVAGAGTGAGLGVVSMGASSELHKPDPNRTRAQADALQSRANSMALGANVSYGVAGAAAVTAVVLFFLEGRD